MRPYFVNIINRVEKINSAVTCKSAVLTGILLCMMAVSIGVPLIKESDSFSTVVVADSFLSLAAIFVLINRKSIEDFHIKKTYVIPLLLIGISFIFNGVYYSVMGYLAVGLIFCILIPLINLVFYSNSHVMICTAVSKAVIISFIAFVLISIMSGAALGKTQYTAILSNPNTLGNYMLIVVAANIYLMCDRDYRKNKCFPVLYITLALAVVIAIYTNSRTSMIAIFLQLVVVSLMYLARKIKCRDISGCLRLVKRGFIFILTVAVMFFAMFFILTTVKVQLIKALPDIQITKKYDDVELKDLLNRMGARYTKGLNNSDKSSLDDDQFTSGRKEIWKDYIDNIGFLGHKTESRNIVEKLRIYHGTNAHNVYLQMAYSAGLIAGMAMIIIMIFAAKDLLQKMYRFIRKGIMDDGLVLTICCALGFVTVSLTSGGYMIYTYLPSTFFYLSLFTLSVNERNKEYS